MKREQSLAQVAQVAKARTQELYQESFEQGMKAQEMYDKVLSLLAQFTCFTSTRVPILTPEELRKPRNSLVHVDEAGHVDLENFGSNVREHFLPNSMRPGK